MTDRDYIKLRANAERETKLGEVIQSGGFENESDAIEASLDAYLQLDALLNREIDSMVARINELDGDGIGVEGYVQLDY